MPRMGCNTLRTLDDRAIVEGRRIVRLPPIVGPDLVMEWVDVFVCCWSGRIRLPLLMLLTVFLRVSLRML